MMTTLTIALVWTLHRVPQEAHYIEEIVEIVAPEVIDVEVETGDQYEPMEVGFARGPPLSGRNREPVAHGHHKFLGFIGPCLLINYNSFPVWDIV